MLAILIPLVAGSAQPITGACQGSTTFPAEDEQCASANRGHFNAQQLGLNTAKECATYAKEQCNGAGVDKAAYITFVGGEHNVEQGTGICAWFALDQCGCYDSKNCADPKDAGGNVISTAETGSIAGLMDETADGIPLQRGDGEAATNPAIQDPNYIKDSQIAAEADGGEPKGSQFETVTSAASMDLNELGKNTEIVDMKTDTIEPSCAEGEVAVKRGEWECIVLEDGGLYMGSLFGYIIGCLLCGIIAASLVHWKGKDLRAKAEPADDAGSDDEN